MKREVERRGLDKREDIIKVEMSRGGREGRRKGRSGPFMKLLIN